MANLVDTVRKDDERKRQQAGPNPEAEELE
jgi:ribosome-binding factor A